MNVDYDATLWGSFFAVDTVASLKRFAATLDPSIPEQAALAYYISTWPAFSQDDDTERFAPATQLSPDRSAVMYGRAPVIFEGTNHWSSKPYLSAHALKEKLRGLFNVVTGVRQSNPNARMTLVLVPEKDYVISRFLLNETRFSAFDEAINSLREQLKEHDIPLVFNQPFRGIDKYQTLADFEYKDSHLAGRNYVTVFGFILQSLGNSWAEVKPRVGLKTLPEFGDLATKFENGLPTQKPALQPNVEGAAVTQTAGTESFADPLGKTWQEFHNTAPAVDQSVCLLGDSHCSIFNSRKLAYLFASTFRDTHFEWNPCGIRRKPDVSSYDSVVLEISSRFVV